jgi:hypothetical protein
MNWSGFAAVGAVSIAAAMTPGCATITASKTELVAINSHPDGAQVRVDGMPRGFTPMTVEVEKKRPPKIQLSMPGYQPGECRLRTYVGAGYAIADVAMCAVLFPLGCASFIDANGAWNELEATTCNVGLQPTDFVPTLPPQAAAPERSGTVHPQRAPAVPSRVH